MLLVHSNDYLYGHSTRYDIITGVIFVYLALNKNIVIWSEIKDLLASLVSDNYLSKCSTIVWSKARLLMSKTKLRSET